MQGTFSQFEEHVYRKTWRTKTELSKMDLSMFKHEQYPVGINTLFSKDVVHMASPNPRSLVRLCSTDGMTTGTSPGNMPTGHANYWTSATIKGKIRVEAKKIEGTLEELWVQDSIVRIVLLMKKKEGTWPDPLPQFECLEEWNASALRSKHWQGLYQIIVDKTFRIPAKAAIVATSTAVSGTMTGVEPNYAISETHTPTFEAMMTGTVLPFQINVDFDGPLRFLQGKQNDLAWYAIAHRPHAVVHIAEKAVEIDGCYRFRFGSQPYM